jgi:hypothetical protein
MDASGYAALLHHNATLPNATGVEGWFSRTDADLMIAVDRQQLDDGLDGDILEIGSFKGASAILLGCLLRSGEELVVCDPFGGAGIGDREPLIYTDFVDPFRRDFEANYLRFHERLPRIVQTTSDHLPEANLGRRFRIIHVDGAHHYEAVRQDLLLTRDLLVPGGVVIFDDVLVRHTPGVTAAVWEGVVNDGLIPLFQSNKLYASWSDAPSVVLPTYFDTFEHTVAGHRMRHVSLPRTSPSLLRRTARHLRQLLRRGTQPNT